MTDYHAPTTEMRFVLDTICDIAGLQKFDIYQEATGDLVDAVLEEAGKLTSGVIAPLNRIGDEVGCILENGVVRTPEGFKEAYQQYVEGGWNGLAIPVGAGGQGLPYVMAIAAQEMLVSANMAFSLCPMLTHGSLEAMLAHGSDELRETYLAKMVSGEWPGTMNLTEPQAGSDVGAVKTRAEPAASAEDGSWRIKGTKIFITWGEHDMAENIIHLVLARTPDSPPGTKGISMFLVPKFLVGDDGSLGARNDMKCVSLEHKLGIHASPTCVLSFGDNDDCIGYLIGGEHEGMRGMFTMMNLARINVGLQGVGIAERATQQALEYARERTQGRATGIETPPPHAIIHHPDVRRMLMTMRALTEATRAITYLNASAVDRARHHPDDGDRKSWAGLVDLLTPVTKAFCTDCGVEVASLGIQIHGGMGYIEETGAAQHWRDARIAPIYEGTNGVQAMDLVGRKLHMDGGAHWRHLFREIGLFTEGLPKTGDLAIIRTRLEDAVVALHNAAEWLFDQGAEKPRAVGAGAAPFTRMFGLVLGGYLLAKQAAEAGKRLDADDGAKSFLEAKIATARFYAERILPETVSLHAAVTAGDDAVFAIPEEGL